MTLDEEKQKLKYSHKLELWRIGLDKALFAGLILLAGFVGNLVLEGYKSDLAKSEFLLGKRLEALGDLRVSFSNLSQYAFIEAYYTESAQPDAYAEEVRNFMQIINRWGFLFSDDLTRELTHFAWIHQAVAGPEIQLTHEHWGFLIDLGESFDEATRTAVNVEVLGTSSRPPRKRFRMQTWTSENVRTKGTANLFRENFTKWQKENPTP